MFGGRPLCVGVRELPSSALPDVGGRVRECVDGSARVRLLVPSAPRHYPS